MRKYGTIEGKVRSISALVQEIAVVEEREGLCAYITPDFDEAQRQGIVNLSDEIRWYAVELYNMHAEASRKIRCYHVLPVPLPKGSDGSIDDAKLHAALLDMERPRAFEPDIDDELYRSLKAYLERLTDRPVYPSSHFEFDLGLDSLDHVELFAFAEESFGVKIHDRSFAAMMTPKAFWRYLKAHRQKMEPKKVVWSKLLHRKRGMALHRSPWVLTLYKWLAMPLFRLYFRLSVSGQEHLPEAPCIIAPSHQSMLDGFIISAALPQKVLTETYTLAFDKVFGRGLMTPVARYGQLVLIDVNNDLKDSIESSAVPLMEGKNIVIFPEGARSRDRELLEFKPLFTMLSKEFDVPVVPVVLDGTFEALRAGMLFPRPAKVVVKFLEPVYPEEGESAELMAMRVKKRIKEDMDAHPMGCGNG